jgi:DNA polymerase I-like protein with 3'-5' exonuclease and polymerase domains
MDWRVICIADFLKAWRESENPQLIRPFREAWVTPTLSEIRTWREIATWSIGVRQQPLAVDCETNGSLITCISFAHSSKSAITIPFRSKDGTHNYWATFDDELLAWHEVLLLLESGRPLVFQNGMYDMQFLIRMGFNCKNARHDTMLLHHSLYPEVQKSLGFLGSIYTNESSWKLLRKQRATKVKGDKLDE